MSRRRQRPASSSAERRPPVGAASRATRLLPLATAAVVLIATRIAAWRALPFAAEDAYITFRYARHLAAGHGAVFNPGEWVMGFTSPPWMAWIAAGFGLGVDPVTWTRATTLALELAALAVVMPWLSRISSGAAWSFGLAYAAWPTFAALAASGLETPLFLPLTVIAVALAASRSAAAGPAIAALACLRPEGMVMACAPAWIARGRDRAIAAMIVLATLALLAARYGSPLPNSVTAKSTLYGTPGPWAGRAWWEWLSPLPFGDGASGEARLLRPLAWVLVPLLIAGAARLWRERGRLAAAAAALTAPWLGYAALGVAYFWWYLAAPLSAAALIAACGVPWLARRRFAAWGAAAWCAGACVLAWPAARALYVGRAQNEAYAFGAAADALFERARPGDHVLLEPIGMVGWRAPVVVIDEVGLVSPAVARRRLEGPGWYSDVVRAQSPEWLLIRRGVRESTEAFAGAGAPFRSVAERESLFAGYAVAARIDEVSGPNALWLYRRRAPDGAR